jgi:tRNA nucleotidyltransferase/poly(A) polymerase
MSELAQEVLAGEEAWVVGGALRDELLGRPVVDVDIAVRRPEEAARAYARRSGGAPFPLSEQHGAWRVALDDGRTIDFTPLRGTIEADLATRDFTVNALARPLAGGEIVDPSGGLEDVDLRSLRAVTETIFEDDPLRLLRAARLEDELGFRLAPLTEELVRAHVHLAAQPAGERILAELERLSAAGFRRLDELGLLAPLGGSLERGDLLEAFDSPAFRLAVVFGPELRRYPISNERKRLLRALLRAERPSGRSARAIHRFRRATEPWALEALAFVGAPELAPEVEAARANDPDEPLLRGDELGLPPGPEIGRLLAAVEEERAAGLLSTREEALEFVRRSVSSS